MLHNFLKVALRHLLSNKVYVSINIVGLGMALAGCIVAYQNSKFNWDFNASHEQIDHIYKVNSIRDNKGDIRELGRVPMPLATAVKNDLPGVDRVFRFESHVFTVRDAQLGKDKVFNTSLCYVDKGFLSSFTFPAVKGEAADALALDQAIVTDRYARKFYGEEDPLGKVLTVFDDTGMSFNFVISAVVQKPPVNSSIQFDVMVSFDNRFRMYDDGVKGDWGSFAQNTFVYLEDPSKARDIEQQLGQYLEVQHGARPDFMLSQFVLSPMSEHAETARSVDWDNLNKAIPKVAILTPQVMALLILLVACFNFTNTAIANSNRRLKEIGVRKVLGGNRRQLINQFMLENLAICALALIVGVSIAIYLVPAYGAMWGDMELKMDFEEDILLYFFLSLLLLVTTVIAGLYPSLFVSRYKPVTILRGRVSVKGTSTLTKVLLATQYAFTAITIFASVAFVQNARYQDTLDMGYAKDQVIGIQLLNQEQYDKIRDSMLSHPGIESVASAKNHIGQGNYDLTMKSNEVEVNLSILDVGVNYIETMALEVAAGRSFDPKLEASDSKNAIVVNEKTVEAYGWTDPIGQQLTFNDTASFTVIGVVEDFYLYGFWSPLRPVAFRLQSLRFEDDGTYNYIIARTNSQQVAEVYTYLEEEWNEKIPNKTFSGFYQDALMEEAKRTNNNILTIFSYIGVVAFVLSSLGLFTMVSINLVKRTKEIGVRKVLGSSTTRIVLLISGNYLLMLFVSSIVGIGAGYYLVDALIASIFRNYKDMDIVTFVIPLITITGLSFVVAGLRTFQSAIANPTRSLRYE